jgi:hypothetical protein
MRYCHVVGIGQLHLKCAYKCRNQAAQLCLRKILPDTAPWPMQEGQCAVVARRAAHVVRPACVGIDPALGDELGCVRAPKVWRPVDGPRHQQDLGAARNCLVDDGRVPDGVTDRDGHGWIQADCLVAYAIEQWERFQNCSEVGFRAWIGWKCFLYFLPKPGLNIRICG